MEQKVKEHMFSDHMLSKQLVKIKTKRGRFKLVQKVGFF